MERSEGIVRAAVILVGVGVLVLLSSDVALAGDGPFSAFRGLGRTVYGWMVVIASSLASFVAVKKARRLSEQEHALLTKVGALMRGARRGHGSQRDVADKVGVSQSRISRWESGRAIPDALELMRFADACSTRPERLIEGVAMPTVEQLHMELDPKAGAIVGELVQILHDRRAPSPTTDKQVA